MSDKKDIYVCKGCPTENCFAQTDKDCSVPAACTIGASWETNWQKTTDYEIRGKPEAIPLKPKAHYFSNKEAMLEFTERRIEPRPTPNCSICEWKSEAFISHLVHEDHSRIDHIEQIECSLCAAQGLKDADDCYNSDECKRLFKDKAGQLACAHPESEAGQ